MNSTPNTMNLQGDVDALKNASDQMFLIFMGLLIFFCAFHTEDSAVMQCGFAFLEAGSVRSKNTTNILLKNVLDVFIGCISYFLFGYAFAFGQPSNGFIGGGYFALAHLPPSLFSMWFFQFVFAATAATIVSGAMAERTDFLAYVSYSIALTGFIYPVVTHWAWDPSGWLYVGVTYTDGNETLNVTYQDFAGSGVVHILGGACAFVGAVVLGPRIGRFVDGEVRVIPGHTVPKCALGGFLLFFGFLAFNGGSQGQISAPGDGETVAKAIVNTFLAGGGGAITSMLIKRLGFHEKNWSLLITINGGLCGMVAICAGCNIVHPYAALIIGIIAGAVYMGWSIGLLRARIDDPIDAVAVHFGGGFWGVLAVTFFNHDTGIFYKGDGHSFRLFGWNLLGALVITAWSAGLAFVLFFTMMKLGVLRVSEEIEIKGLDIPKHGEPAYPIESYGDGWTEITAQAFKKLPYTKSVQDLLVMMEQGRAEETAEVANGHGEPANDRPKPKEINLSSDDISYGIVLNFGGRKHSIGVSGVSNKASDTGL